MIELDNMNKIIMIISLFSFISISYSQELDSLTIRSNIQILGANSPGYFITKMGINPFSPAFENTFGIQDSAKVNIFITNNSARVVKSIYKGYLNKGIYKISWDMTDENKKILGKGFYYFEIEVNYPAEKKEEINTCILFKGKTRFIVP